jgi:predicted ATPase/DNA-binding XRE family transcriptional regulator
VLRQYRRAAGLTHEALAEAAGLSPRTVSDLERGVSAAPRRDTLAALAAALGVTPEQRAALELAARRAPEPADATVRRHNLPVQLSTFVGREQELGEVQALVRRHRLATLTGAGGCGKTRLALRAAADLFDADAFADGAWLVDLAPIADSALIARAALTALGAREVPGHAALDTLVDFLHARTTLLVLDNCEHLVVACAGLADALLRACPGLRVLATSREPLGVPGEAVWRVPSLGVPPPGAADADVGRSEAVRLFTERARLVQPGYAVTAANAAAVAQLCRRLDGIPLALELAAARAGSLTVEQIAARLDDRFRLLTGGARTALRRQQTLRATVDWSYDLLAADERALLRRLSVFAGGWTLEAAEAVGAGLPDALGLMLRLVDKSLVVMDVDEDPAPTPPANGGAGPRYRLLETIRQYAQEKLLEADEAHAARDRHRDYFLTWAERAALEVVATSWSGTRGLRPSTTTCAPRSSGVLAMAPPASCSCAPRWRTSGCCAVTSARPTSD